MRKNNRSIKFLSLYFFLSCSRCLFRKLLDGITASVPLFFNSSKMALVSYPLSAITTSLFIPPSKFNACVQSFCSPEVKINFRGLPSLLHKACILLVLPPLDAPMSSFFSPARRVLVHLNYRRVYQKPFCFFRRGQCVKYHLPNPAF